MLSSLFATIHVSPEGISLVRNEHGWMLWKLGK